MIRDHEIDCSEISPPADFSRTKEKKNPKGSFDNLKLLSALVGSLSLQACTDHAIEHREQQPAIEVARSPLLISDLNPPRAPIVLPLENGQRTRISQRAGGNTSHNTNDTMHALDFSDDSFVDSPHFALTPITGTLRQRPNHGGWGNNVEIIGRDGSIYIFAHCHHFLPEAPDGAFVLRGTPVCQIGSTGISDSVHLHFDKVERNGNYYRSLGVPDLLTMKVDEPNLSLINPNTAEVCCHRCEITPGNRECAFYISFNRSLTDTLETFSENIQRADPRNLQFESSLVVDEQLSRDKSPWIYAHRDAVPQAQQQVHLRIYLIVTSPSGAGQRNPFIDTAFSYIGNRDGPIDRTNYEFNDYHTQIHTEKFINFDLWDLARGVIGPEVPFPESVIERPDWHPDFELWQTTINGRSFVLAVLKRERSHRAGAFQREDGSWSDWYLM